MATKAPGFSLFNDAKGFDLQKLPAPYNGWNKMSQKVEHKSIHNPGTSTSPLSAYITQALLEYADTGNCAIGVVRIATGSYASQWNRPDGSAIVAHATSNGILSAGIRDGLTGKITPLPQIGSSVKEFNNASLMILYMLIEADINEERGNTERTITKELLQQARDEFAATGEVSEDVVRLVSDDLYHAVGYGTIPVNIRAGNITKLTERRLANNEFSSGTVICGNPDIFVPKPSASNGGEGPQNIKTAKIIAEPYTSTLSWTKEEEMMIPQFDDDVEVPPEVMTILNRFLASREWANPLNNPCWRGITAYGKSTGVKILACILHTPLLWMTCATTTEVEDFLSKHVPNTDESDAGIDMSGLPTFDDISFDPEFAYESITGETRPGVTSDEVLAAYAAEVAKRQSQAKNPFKIVESEFVKALMNGYIVEVQEFSRIRDSGTLVGLNNFSDPGSVIPLVDGRHVRRHKNAMVIWTDNIGYQSCRKVDGSVLRRMSYIIDSLEMPRDRALRRIKKNTGCKEDAFLDKMYDVWSAIAKYCKDHDIIDEGTCSLTELESWVALTMLDGKDAISDTCREAIVAKVSSDPDTQQELMDSCVAPNLSKYGLAS